MRRVVVIAAACACLSGFGPPAAATAKGTAFEINAVPYPTSSDARKMRKAGIDRARFDLNWSLIQPTKGGPYDWASYDREIARLASSKIRALPIVIGSPGWAAPHPLHPPISSRIARKGWRAFLGAAVKRYGPHGEFWSARPNLHYRPVNAWQIWNEPNYPASWMPRPSPHDYVRLLRASAKKIRSLDRSARIVSAGLGPGRSGGGKYSSYDFLAHMYRLGAKPFFDAAALDVYAADVAGDAAQIKKFAGVMRRRHDSDASLWVTEAGWSSRRDPGHRWAAGSEARQARLERGLFQWVIRHGRRLNIGALYWFDWRDTPIPGNRHYDFGLRRHNGTAKPAFRVFSHFAR